jgi:hypothetical protein
MLNGSLGLASDPSGLSWDLVWAKGKVQQVWGLGVPAWRLPFELAARTLGFQAFPDRLAFGVAIAGIALLIMRVFLPPRSLNHAIRTLRRNPVTLAAPLLFVLFPPFLTLCRAPFMVYDEAAAYAYLTGIGLCAGTIAFVRRPTRGRYWALATLGGLAAFVRPTLIFYGLASLAVSFGHTRRLAWPLKQSLQGVALWGLGLALLFATNLHRFGSGFEFGHSLIVNHISDMRYVTRFSSPYESEPLPSAAKELFGILFVAGDAFNAHDRYQLAMFSGQSLTFRWRELYFETFDLSFFAVVSFAWIWLILQWGGVRRDSQLNRRVAEIRALALWSLLAAVPIFLFYLRCHFISSRYLLDFAPAFAAAMVSTLSLAARRVRSRNPWAFLLLTVFAVWWSYEALTARVDPEAPVVRPERYMELRLVKADWPIARSLPNSYSAGMNPDSREASFFRPFGWDPVSGETDAGVLLFVSDIEFLEVEVASSSNEALSRADCACIQAKVGLEVLQLKDSRRTGDGWLLTFHRPQQVENCRGIQSLMLGMVPVEALNQNPSRFRLLSVRWRR